MTKARPFVAWDSEGVTRRNGEHDTICIGNSAGNLLVRDGYALRSREMLDFMCDNFEADAINVMYGMDYDVNQLLRDLPRTLIEQLWVEGMTWWRTAYGDYSIAYIPRKLLRIFRWRDGRRCGGTVHDVFGFWQTSFVTALQRHGLDVQRIAEMKQLRSDFAAVELERIVSYMREEMDLLVQLCGQLRQSLDLAGIRISHWAGAGSIASAMLRQHNVRRHLPPSGSMTRSLTMAIQHAYFGGRAESIRFGTAMQPVWSADIRSAYPAAMEGLPCLACGGRWEWVPGSRIDDSFGVYRVDWQLSPSVIYPFPWRSARTGNVYFPEAGKGWYWAPEAIAAMAVHCDGIRVHGSWRWIPACSHRPFAFIRELYERRRQYKAAGNTGELAIKLGMNAIYGKLAQQVGTASWQCMAWAGWVTSHTRAQMYLTAQALGESLVMLSTDGIMSTVPIAVTEGEGLGHWEVERYDGITVLQSGIYWLWRDDIDSTRSMGNARIVKLRARGYGGRRIDAKAIERALIAGARAIEIPINQYVGMGRALRSDRQWKLWRTWQTDVREMSLLPGGKRERTGRHTGGSSLRMTRAAWPVHDMMQQQWMSARPLAVDIDREIAADPDEEEID